MQAYCRVAPSLGDLEGNHQQVWGTCHYIYRKHKDKPTVFFGLYDLRDYIALWRHKGRKWVLWAGSDLENLSSGFLFNDGKLRTLSKIFKGNKFIKPTLKRATHFVENRYEKDMLNNCIGEFANIVPSFMGNVKDFPISYKHSENPNVYLSAHPGREEEYGFEIIERIANKVPECTFHLYGSDWKSIRKNVVCHGLVTKERFNADIRAMQCGLRLNKHDGFSEITAKSILMGQYPITKLFNPRIPNYFHEMELVALLRNLKTMKKPNLKARDYYISIINKYPWFSK